MLGSMVGNAMNMATQDTLDVTRIRCCGRGTRGRFLGLFGSISHECGGVTRGGAGIRNSSGRRSFSRIQRRWKKGHISGGALMLMDLNNIQVVS